jgi:hypothetical protein
MFCLKIGISTLATFHKCIENVFNNIESVLMPKSCWLSGLNGLGNLSECKFTWQSTAASIAFEFQMFVKVNLFSCNIVHAVNLI